MNWKRRQRRHRSRSSLIIEIVISDQRGHAGVAVDHYVVIVKGKNIRSIRFFFSFLFLFLVIILRRLRRGIFVDKLHAQVFTSLPNVSGLKGNKLTLISF